MFKNYIKLINLWNDYIYKKKLNKKYYFVDYENVYKDGLEINGEFDYESEIYIFFTDNCKNIPLKFIEQIKKNINVTAMKVVCGSKNALDFQLVSMLGYYIGIYGVENEYYIISKDKGYDAVINLWKKRGVKINRFNNLSGEYYIESKVLANKNITKSQKKTSSTITTIDEIKKYISDEINQDEILNIINSNNTKISINNKLNKLYKDSRKSSVIYKKLKPLMKEKNKI